MSELTRMMITNEVKTDKDYEGKALKDNEIEMIGSTASTDRDGESIQPKGIDLKAFKRNPIILAQHDYRKPVIGKATKVRVIDDKLVFKIQFTNDGDNPEADIYRKLYKSGFMNASSIGFIPKEWVDGNGKKEPYRTYTKAELLELSLVSVPANSEAVVVGRSMINKGIITEEEARTVGIMETEVTDESNNISKDLPEETKEEEAEIKTINDATEKDAEPSYLQAEWIETHNAEHIALDKRMIFLEGVIAGLQKEATKHEQKSYIEKLLGDDRAVRTEDHTEKVDDQISSIEKIFKGDK